MKAEELRLGNLIRYGNPIHKDLPIHKITGIMAHSFWLDGSVVSSENSNVIGIPLTEEWLLKFGFEKNGNVWETDSINGIIFEIEFVSDCYYLHTQGEWGYQGFLYVHQLQNVFYAITGQELTLKQ